MFHFQINQHQIQLVLPKIKQAPALAQVISRNCPALSQWLPWVKQIRASADEARFLSQIQAKIAQKQICAWTILVDHQPAGMIDLHNIIFKQKGELGYWLAAQDQGQGIVTQSVLIICHYAWQQLNLKYLDIIVAKDNLPSIHVAQGAGFKLMGTQPHLIGDQTGEFFRKIRPNT